MYVLHVCTYMCVHIHVYNVCFFIYIHAFHLKNFMISLWHIQIDDITTLGFGAIIKYNKGFLNTSTAILLQLN